MGAESSKDGKHHRRQSGTSERQRQLVELFRKHAGDAGVMSQEHFKTLFSITPHTSPLPHLLFSSFASPPPSPLVDERRFMEGGERILGLMSEVDFLVTLYLGQGQITSEDLHQLVYDSFICSRHFNGFPCDHCDTDESREILTALVKSMPTSSTHDVSMWINTNSPKLLSPIHSFLVEVLTSIPPRVSTSTPTSTHLLSPSVSWLLYSTLSSVYTTTEPNTPGTSRSRPRLCCDWSLLYDSHRDGSSTTRLEHHTFTYPGPSLTLISTSNHLYAAACDVEWREHPKHWGGHHCSVLQILPEFSELQHGSDLFYYNIKSRHLNRGLQLGSDHRHPLLHIDSDLSEVKGKLLPSHQTHHLNRIEVWGCGGSKAGASQASRVKWERREVEKGQKVSRPGRWDENPDKFILDLAGIRTDHRDRPDTCEVLQQGDVE